VPFIGRGADMLLNDGDDGAHAARPPSLRCD
jgi:hypothetical protein